MLRGIKKSKALKTLPSVKFKAFPLDLTGSLGIMACCADLKARDHPPDRGSLLVLPAEGASSLLRVEGCGDGR